MQLTSHVFRQILHRPCRRDQNPYVRGQVAQRVIHQTIHTFYLQMLNRVRNVYVMQEVLHK